MPLHFVYRYRRADARSRPDALFVFGDNMERQGFGGQAKELRGEPNAVGIPTKWSPTRRQSAYFMDEDFPYVKKAINEAFDRLESHLAQGGTVFWPTDGVGSGLADLPRRAPNIDSYIKQRLHRLSEF